MSEDPRFPPPELLQDDGIATKDVMALVGFAGQGEDGAVRLYPDVDFQRWMDIPTADIVGQSPLDVFNPGRHGRTVVWVKQEAMEEEVFDDGALGCLMDHFRRSRMSVWPMIPATRLVAAQLLDLVPHLRYEKAD